MVTSPAAAATAAAVYSLQVKLLDKMMHAMAEQEGQQVVLLSQVLASEVNIGYEDMLNTQVMPWTLSPVASMGSRAVRI